MRIGVGTIGVRLCAVARASSNVALGEDIDRAFGLRVCAWAGDGSGEGTGDAEGGLAIGSSGCVWLRVGVLRVLAFSRSSRSFAALFARRARRSLMLGFDP